MLCVTSFELSLPQVVVSVNEARADDLAIAVDELSARGCVETFADFGNAIGLDQDVGLS